MPGGKRRRPFSLVDTNPTSVQNMLLDLEMADQANQSIDRDHFYEYWKPL